MWPNEKFISETISSFFQNEAQCTSKGNEPQLFYIVGSTNVFIKGISL